MSFFKEVLKALKAKQLESPDGTGVDQDFVHVKSPLDDIKSILNQAIEGDYSELDEIVKNIEGYRNKPIKLDSENLKNFCSQWFGFKLDPKREIRRDHHYIHSNILSHYSCDEQFIYKHCVSELLLLAIAANDQLAERYHKELFAEKNLSLLPLLVGGKWYVSEFIERFHELYSTLKGKTITLFNRETISLFSAMALRKEQGLLDAVLVQYALNDLKPELQKDQEAGEALEAQGHYKYPPYGVLAGAAMVGNNVFVEKVLEFIEKGDSSGNDLLKSSVITLLVNAVSMEVDSIVECLCKKCIEHKNPVVQKIYQAALSDDEVIKQIKKQILGNIHCAEGNRLHKQQDIYETILKTASRVNNMKFVVKILDEIESNPQLFTTDKDGKNLLRDSLNTILEHDEGRILIEKRMSAEMDDKVEKIYDEVYKSRKAFDPIQEIDTTVSTGQKAIESNSPEENTMTNDNEITKPTTESHAQSRSSSTESISNDSGVGESGGSDSADEEQPSLTGTENSSRTPENNDQKPIKQVHFPNGSQLERVHEIIPCPNSNEELDETPGHKFRIADSLYAKLQAKKNDGEYYDSAKSGGILRKDLSRNGIIINDKEMPAGDIKELYNTYEKNPQNSLITMATSILALAFENTKKKVPKTEVPTASIIKELAMNYNQIGHWAFTHEQVGGMLQLANLGLPTIKYKPSIYCDHSNCVIIKFEFLGYIAPLDDGTKELCKLNSTLKFNLEATDEGVEYKDVIISLDSSKELEVRYVEVPRDNPEADASEAPKIKVVSLIPEIRKYLSSGVLPGFSTSTKIDVLHNGEVVFSYDKNEKRNQRSKRSTIKNENADQGTVGQHSQSQSNKTYRNALFTTTIATFTVALTATAAASVFTAIYHETMPIKLVEAVGTYSLGIALIAACCLAVTAIIYCCTKPANLLENNNIEGRINSQIVTGS
ncbi:hypothetical protein IC220_02725 [Wolbachia endosymbiont of Pentalonia nigronervosa]|nr:hypothetical protein [Wolbachia endosymbiont of Pentalonia nigronervosa]